MDTNVNSAWSAVRAVLDQDEFSFNEIKKIVGLAGFDLVLLSDLEQKSKSGNTKGQLFTAIDKGFGSFDEDEKKHFLCIVIEEMFKRNNDVEKQLEEYLNRLGWQLIDNSIVPVGILDKKDLEEMEDASKTDLLKAAVRFRDGDLSGALLAACGAIQSVVGKIYQSENLPAFNKASFQESCNKALKAIGIFDAVERDLKKLGWEDSKIKFLLGNLKSSLNGAAHIMQSLRSNMSDAHGSKPVLKPLVFDSIKWSEIIIRLLSDKYNKK